jgi:aspartate/methionine/tyrosine aminotransferase
MSAEVHEQEVVAVVVPIYRSQEWLFDVAAGRFDLDLAISGMESRPIGDLLDGVERGCGYDIDRGAAALRTEVADQHGVPAERVLITHGAQEALYLVYAALLRQGDEVVVRTPGWQQSIDLPPRFGATVRAVDIDIPGADADGPHRTARQIGSATRMAVLNYPHNPTGLDWDREQWRSFAAELAVTDRDVLIVNDQEYLTDYATSTLQTLPDACVVGSLSKVYGFPGLRLGWLIGPQEVIEECVNYRRYTTISNSPPLESLALMVLRRREQYLAEYRDRLATGWSVFEEWAAGHSQLEPVRPNGTPFVLCRVRIPDVSSMELAVRLLDREQLVVMPGDAFGAPGYLRISYARPEPVLREGLERIGRVLRSYAAEPAEQLVRQGER